MTRRRKRGVKRVKSNLASNQYPKCSPRSGTPRVIQELHREDKREEGDRTDQEEKGERGGSKEERAIKTVTTTLNENGY